MKMINYKIRQWNKVMKAPVVYLGLALAIAPFSLSFAATLQNLDVVSLPGEKVQLKLTFDQPISTPKGYTVDQPARIALDFPGISNKLKSKRQTVNIGNVRDLVVVEANDTTRLVVNLNTLMPYSTKADGNSIYVTLGDQQSKPAVASTTPLKTTKTVTANASPTTSPKQSTANSINAVDFRRGTGGEGTVIIKLSDNSINPEIVEKGGNIVINFPKVVVPESLRARLDVKDFATPVQYVNVSGTNNGASISIEPKGGYDYLVYQADDELTISVKHVSAAEKQKMLEDKGVFKGDTLSLNFQDIEVRSVLQILADFTKLNLVATDSVNGSITLRLVNVPWDQALDIIMRTKGLGKHQEGNILIVAPADELAETMRKRANADSTIKALQPLRTEIIQISYANAKNIVELFKETLIKPAANSNYNNNYQANYVNDDRGALVVDERTNTIIAYQTEERLDELRRMVAVLDKPVPQVEIEARIVEANTNFAKSLGVRWAFDSRFGEGRASTYGGADGRYEMSDTGGASKSTGTNVVYDDSKGYLVPAAAPMVDLGATGATSGFGFAYFAKNFMLDLKLNAMQTSGQGEVVSRPKVVTSDKEEATIIKGNEVPYQEASSSGATTTSFKQAALTLKVKPQITPDNQVFMDITVTKDSVDKSISNASNVPGISKNEIQAKVLVGDGQTIVIGGVFENTQEKTSEKVPFLGDLPVIGRLFRRDTVNNTKKELLVFLTPRIIDNKAFAANR